MECGSKAKSGQKTCMGIIDEALSLERSGKPIIHLEKGELDIDTPQVVKELAIQAILDNQTRYSHSSGLPELRQAVCDYYERVYGISFDPKQVIINSGSSPAMLELLLSFLSPGDEVILPNPGYPAYPYLVESARGKVVWVGTQKHRFVYNAELVHPHISALTKAIFINFPSNPVGETLDVQGLRDFAELRPLIISDEVYHRLTFEKIQPHTILEFTKNAVVVGSFSKGFAMTGWRLGYLIVPDWLADELVRLHGYIYVGTNTFVQWAAISALENADAILLSIREELYRRCNKVVCALPGLGFEVTYAPRGGFYVFARLPDSSRTSADFAADLLKQAHIAITPGTEFGSDGEGYVRFSLSAPCNLIEEAMERIGTFMQKTSTVSSKGQCCQ